MKFRILAFRLFLLFMFFEVRQAFSAEFALRRLSDQEIPQFQIDDSALGSDEAGSRELFELALRRQVPLCGRLSESWDFAGVKVSQSRWCRDTIRWFLAQLESGFMLNDVFQKARAELQWFESTGKPGTREVQFTGYYFPVYRAKLLPDDVYKFPVYRAPSDLVRPYFSRAQIDEGGAIRGRGLEIAYLDNPVDPYILQVQGSGALLLDSVNGGTFRWILNYAADNGRPYSSLGRAMRLAGIAEEFINLQGIKRYFTELHPEKWSRFANQNESYVFFKRDEEGPYGFSGVVLTPKHSIAVDRNVFPMGAVGLIETERPDQVEGDQAISWKRFAQFVVAQDTGGAIKTPGRVDVFWGEGPYAEVAAGRTDRLGRLFFMLVPPKQ
ncbi:MAG: MltA domain-containing protein [Bdellovibrionales bacterium]|nr:MltA domain-containing protein [Bdellovibrionales bacterium]